MGEKKLPSRILTILLFVVLIAIVLVGAFATRTVRERITKNQIPTREISSPSPTPQKRSIYLDLPQTFPKDVPIPTSAKVTAVNEDTTAWTAVFLTSSSLENTRDFYSQELPKAGFSITNKSGAAGLTIIYARKEKREVIVTVGRGDRGITVSLTILKGS